MPPFSSPQGNAPQTLAALWSLMVIALMFVCLRLYTRYKVVDAIGIDDHLLNTAFVSGAPELLTWTTNTTDQYCRTGLLKLILSFSPGYANRILYTHHNFRLLRIRLDARRSARSLGPFSGHHPHWRRTKRYWPGGVGVKELAGVHSTPTLWPMRQQDSIHHHHTALSTWSLRCGGTAGFLDRVPACFLSLGPIESQRRVR